MTNNYPERELGGRGGSGRPPTHGQPWVAGGMWTGFPGTTVGLGKVRRFGKEHFSLHMFTVSFHQRSEIQMGSEIPLL